MIEKKIKDNTKLILENSKKDRVPPRKSALEIAMKRVRK